MAADRDPPLTPYLVWRTGTAHAETRARYLLVVEDGAFNTPAEVARLHRWLEAWIEGGAPRRLLFDVRPGKVSQEPAAVRDARWSWLLRDDGVHRAAFVVASEARVASVNMRAISERANVRAFTDAAVAHRWLCARTRTFPGNESAATTRLRAVRREDDERLR